MKLGIKHAIWMLMVVLMAGCEQKPAPTPPEDPLLHGYLDKAQPRLATIKVFLGKEELQTEIARTSIQIMTGMMWRTNMQENEAMLFVFNRPHQASFYMRNTLIPLSCAYIDSDGVILELHDMKPKDESSIPASTDRVQFVLETKQGWFQRHNIGPGTYVTSQNGSLQDTFFKNSP
jgi:uncharacterized membrane protein (UPF0127 family)